MPTHAALICFVAQFPCFLVSTILLVKKVKLHNIKQKHVKCRMDKSYEGPLFGTLDHWTTGPNKEKASPKYKSTEEWTNS